MGVGCSLPCSSELAGCSKEQVLSPGFAPAGYCWDVTPLTPSIAEISQGSYKVKNPPEIRGTGYVVHSLEAALWAFYATETFREGCLTGGHGVSGRGEDARPGPGRATATAGRAASTAGARHSKKSVGDLLGTPAMKYPIIKQLSGKFPVRRLCKMLEVSHGGYYEWRGRGPSPRAREDRRLRVQIRAAFGESRDRYGSPRIHKQLRQREIRCCRKRVARLMRQEGLRARQPRRFRVTTRPTPGRSAAPNVLARRFTVDAVDSVWVGDLTYLWTQEGWLYLAVLMDLCSRRIIGWAVSETMTDDLTLAVLDQALGATPSRFRSAPSQRPRQPVQQRRLPRQAA